MMICQDTFYEINLKGKTAEQIMTTIRGLKKKIGRLKNIVEHPEYKCTTHPSEQVRISCSREYLERAKQVLEEVGGIYVPSAAEKKAMEFDKNIPFINKIEFRIGGFPGYETRTYTIDGNKVRASIKHSFIPKPSDIDDSGIEEMDKDYLFDELKNLHIGEWRRRYNTERFGYMVMDGTQWNLEIYYSNGRKPVKIGGSNAYPYNFDSVLELFEINQ